MELLIWILGTGGIALIITKSYLCKPLRSLFWMGDQKMILFENDQKVGDITLRQKITFYLWKLFTCPMCTGTWVGLIMYFFPVDFLLYMGIGSLAAMFAERYINS